MPEGKDSKVDALARGGAGAPRPSEAERLLLAFALDAFGEHLSRFLLAGLGAEDSGRRWRFAVACGGGDGGGYERRVEVITHEPTDGTSLLPRRRDPLVLAALLRLLTRGGGSKPTTSLDYRQEEVLRLLGWEDSEGVRRELDEAVGRYARLTYLSDAGPEELRRRGLAGYRIREAPVTRFSTVDEEGEGGAMRRVSNSVTFSELFINGLLGRSLLGIEWDAVLSVESGDVR